MKILKYSLFTAALLCISGLMSSCDDSTKGAGDATIGFAQAAYTYKESAGLVKIPVQFTGEPAEYPITFNVEAQIEGDEVALEEVVHFTQLTGLKYVGNEDAPAFVEFMLIDNAEINDSRFVTLTITSASGATIATASTRIEVADNDNNPYEKLWGDWTLTGISIQDGSEASFDVNISGGFTEEDVAANADNKLVCWGFGGYQEDVTGQAEPPKQPMWYINYDAETESLSIAVGTVMANIWSFNGIDEDVEIKSASILPGSEDYNYQSEIPGTWSEDYNTLTFEPDYAFVATVWGVSGTEYGYWMGYSKIVLTRK